MEGLDIALSEGGRGGYLSGVGLVVMGGSSPSAFSMCGEQFYCFSIAIFKIFPYLFFELFYYFLD